MTEKIYVVHRDSKNTDVECVSYENDEELEQLYEDYDDSPMIAGTLFLTEEEFQAIRNFNTEEVIKYEPMFQVEE